MLIAKSFGNGAINVFSTGLSSNLIELLDNLSIEVIVLICVTLILLKNVCNIFVARKLFTTLSEFNIEYSARKMMSYLNSNWVKMNKFDIEKLTYAFTDGINAVTIGVLGNFVLAMSEFSLLILILVILSTADVLLVVFSIVFFTCVVFGISRYTSSRVMQAGEILARETITGRGVISDAQSIYREIGTPEKKEFFLSRFVQSKKLAAKAYGDSDFLQQIPKYVLESSSIVGVILLFLVSSLASSNSDAIQISLVFLVASARIIPSVLRLQTYLLSFKRSLGYTNDAQEIFSMIDGKSDLIEAEMNLEKMHMPHMALNGSIDFKNVGFKYSTEQRSVLADFSFHINPKELVALIGESGAGKSTICDLILGYLTPTTGHVRVNGRNPALSIGTTTSKVIYLPQNPNLIRGSIYENVTLKSYVSFEDKQRCEMALRKASIFEFILTLNQGADSVIGQGGLKLSGGQAQRIALARAIYCEPDVLILDEPMASLDDKTSEQVEKFLYALKDVATILVVTHKTTNIGIYDQVLRLDALLLPNSQHGKTQNSDLTRE
jgi:ABC-type multidrug transport system fused ATPase/permease subunit